MKQIWRKTVRTKIKQQEDWYRKTKGEDFAETFARNIAESASLVMSMPSIGQKLYSANGFTHRSILTHPKCRLYYRYNDAFVVFYRVHFILMRE